MWRYKIKCSGVKCHHICNQRLTGEEKKRKYFYLCVCLYLSICTCAEREKSSGCGKMLTIVESEGKWMSIILFFQLSVGSKFFKIKIWGRNIIFASNGYNTVHKIFFIWNRGLPNLLKLSTPALSILDARK